MPRLMVLPSFGLFFAQCLGVYVATALFLPVPPVSPVGPAPAPDSPPYCIVISSTDTASWWAGPDTLRLVVDTAWTSTWHWNPVHGGRPPRIYTP